MDNQGMAKSLPRNLRSNLHTYTMGQIADAFGIAMERAHSTPAGSVARIRAINLAVEIQDHAFDRGFRLVRCLDRFSYERIAEAA